MFSYHTLFFDPSKSLDRPVINECCFLGLLAQLWLKAELEKKADNDSGPIHEIGTF